MCIKCRLTTPCGTDEVCYACALALRAEVRRGLRALELYLSEPAHTWRWPPYED